MFSTSKFKKICTLICSLQFLLVSYAHAEDNSLLVSYGTVNQITNDEQAANYNPFPWLKPGLLNSARIELKFGSYGVQILAQDQVTGVRLSSLYSEHEGEKIARTIAFTQYEANINDKLGMAHKEILAGGSIGSTLKKYEFDVKKDLFFKGLVEDMPDRLQSLMHTQERAFATVIYNLVAKEGNNYYPYCTIVEVYSPEFLTLVDVDQIYPEPIPGSVNPQNAFDAIDIIDRMKQLIIRS
ncbi:MAG: hypothetical protein WC222_05505 [Parachlamydiales bacterium]|jgi:hypothetical protein